MVDIKYLTNLIINFRDKRNWKQFHKPKDLSISLMLEAAEVAEHFQWKSDEEIDKHLAVEKEAIADELADVLYWVLLMSHDFNIDITSALEKKLEKNEQKYPIEKSKDQHTKYTQL